jgi:hypothetical protein
MVNNNRYKLLEILQDVDRNYETVYIFKNDNDHILQVFESSIMNEETTIKLANGGDNNYPIVD